MVGATEGLMAAVNRFNPDLGAFSTYATLWIRQAAERYTRENLYLYHIPLGLQSKLQTASEKAAPRRGRCNDGVILPNEQSLHTPVGEDGSSSLEELIEDDAAASAHDQDSLRELKTIIRDRIAEQDEPSQLILALRYGLGDPSELARTMFIKEMLAADIQMHNILSVAEKGAAKTKKMRTRELKSVPDRFYER